MEKLHILTQHLMLSQSTPKLQHFVVGAPMSPRVNVFEPAILQALLSGLSNNTLFQEIPNSTPSLQSFPQHSNQMKCHQQARNFPDGSNLSQASSEKSDISSFKPSELENSKKPEINFSKKCSLRSNETDELEKSMTKEEKAWFGRKRKNRRLACEIERVFKCPSEHCEKSYGSETSLRVHIKNKHKLMISPKRLYEIESLLSRAPKKNERVE